jgi:hypothetical protein
MEFLKSHLQKIRKLLIGKDPLEKGLDGEMIWDTILPGSAKDFLHGKDPITGEVIANKIREEGRHSNTGRIFMAFSTVDNCLWDLRGKLLGQPVYKILGNSIREEVPVYWRMDIKAGPKALKIGFVQTLTKYGVAVIIGLLVGYFFGNKGLWGISALAFISAMSNTNGGLYTALTAEFGGTGVAGAANASTAGNAVATPAAVAMVDPSLSATAAIATPQVAAAVITTAFLVPVLTAYMAKSNKRKLSSVQVDKTT